MSKLLFNDDGTITVPLIALPPEGGGKPTARSVVLPEPSMRQLAKMHDIAGKADDALPDLEPLPANPTSEQAAQYLTTMRSRTDMQYAEDSPYGLALIETVELLTGETLTPDDLPGWACNPRTMNAILSHFQTPLPGPESDSA